MPILTSLAWFITARYMYMYKMPCIIPVLNQTFQRVKKYILTAHWISDLCAAAENPK